MDDSSARRTGAALVLVLVAVRAPRRRNAIFVLCFRAGESNQHAAPPRAPTHRSSTSTSTSAATTAMSLFGNLGGNQPASSAPKPLFGNLPTASSTGGPSLFSGLGASTTAPAGPSTTTTSSGTGLFAGLGGAVSSAAPTPSLFSGLGAATSQSQSTQQPASTNPFAGNRFAGTGNTTTSAPATQPAATTLFGNTANAANTQQTGGIGLGHPTLFGASSAQHQQQQQQQQAGGPLSQSNIGTSAHFDHLLERSRKRNAGENGFGGFGELPALQLGLGDIARKVRNLGQGGPSADQAQDRTAYVILCIQKWDCD